MSEGRLNLVNELKHGCNGTVIKSVNKPVAAEGKRKNVADVKNEAYSRVGAD